MYLILDTETTGFARFNLPHDHPAQPRIVSLACVLLDRDLKEIQSYNTLIKPVGYTIPDNVVAIHGITTEQALAEGIPIEQAMDTFGQLTQLAEYVFAYNQQFDHKMLMIEAMRMEDASVNLLEEKLRCVMDAMTPVCRIRKKTKPNEYKWPKLKEAYYHFFGEEPSVSHNALEDARNTAAIVRELIMRGIWDVEKDVINEEKI